MAPCLRAAGPRNPNEVESIEIIARRLHSASSIAELGYGVEALDVLDRRMGIHTVHQLLGRSRVRSSAI